MATFSEIVDRVVSATGRSDKQAAIENLVNDEIRAICREHNLYFMEEVVGRMLLTDQHKYALPSDFKDWGEVVLLAHTGAVLPGGTVEALSSAAGDTTQTLTITFVDYVGDKRTETHTLTGVSPVAFTAGMAQIWKLTLSAVCAGTVTVRLSSAGATQATLAPGVTTAEYRVTLTSTVLEGPRSQGYCLGHYGILDTGTPAMFSDDRGELRLWPPLPETSTGHSLRLRYYKFPATLSGSQTHELTTRWPDLLIARVCLAFYNTLPNAGKLADEWRKTLEHPRSGMRGLIRYSNSRRLADLTNNVRERIPGWK